MKLFGFEISGLADKATMEATLASAGSKTTYGGSGMTLGSWVMSSEGGIVIGIALAIGGFIVNWYYSRKRDRREQEEHDLRMQEMRQGISSFVNGK